MVVYNPESLGIKAPAEGFKELGWYQGRQYVGGTLSEPGQIHPSSGQVGAGQQVSPEVKAQSAAQQGVSPEALNKYLQTAGGTPVTPSIPSGVSGAGAVGVTTGVPGITTPQTINLPEMYKGLYETAGISKLEEEYSQKEKEFIEAKGKINDNPFLSEATRVGRIAKLESLFVERTANLQKDIATKKADIETQLNLQTKQFDIESTVAQNALSQLNTLLSMGALENASGETIASLTRSTGISSDMIYSAIEASKKKGVSVTTFDDGTNVYAVALDAMGNVVNKQLLGPSTTKEKGITTTQKQAQSSAIATFLTQEGSRAEAEEAAKAMIQQGYSPEIVYEELERQFPTKGVTVIDEEAVNAYVSMINSEQITLANVPQAYKAEVSKRLTQTAETESLGIWGQVKEVLRR